MDKKERILEVLILASLVSYSTFFYLFRLGHPYLCGWDEPKYAEIGREILVRGKLFPLTFNHKPYLRKPPLLFWLVALSYKIFGVSEFSARLFPAIFSIFLILSTYIFLRMVGDRSLALFSSLILSNSPLLLINGHKVCVDPIFTFFLATSLYSFYLGYRFKIGKLYTLSFLLQGFCVISKGPLGMILFLASVIIFFALKTRDLDHKRIFSIFKEKYFLFGLLMFFLITTPYYLFLILKSEGEFFRIFFLQQNIRRYFLGDYGHNIKPFWYFIPVFLYACFPFWVYLPKSLNLIRSSLKKVESDYFLLFGIWFAFTFIFLSFSRTKLDRYLLLAIPAASVIFGGVISKYIKERNLKGMDNTFLVLLYVLTSFSLLAFPILHFDRIFHIGKGFSTLFYLLGSTSLILSFLLYLSIKRKRVFIFSFSIFFYSTLISSLIIFFVLPMESLHKSSDLVSLAKEAKTLKEPLIITFGFNKPICVFYSEKTVIPIKIKRERIKSKLSILDSLAHSKKGLIIILNKRYLKFLEKRFHILVISNKGKYILAKVNTKL